MLLQLPRRLRNSARTIKNSPRRPRRPRSVPLGLEALEIRAVPATTLTWTGQGNNNLWSTAANWTHTGGGHTTPRPGDAVVFPDGPSNLNSKNDISNLTLASISFAGAGYNISGNGISLSGGITAGSTAGRDTVEVPVTVTQAQNFIVSTGFTLALTGGVT